MQVTGSIDASSTISVKQVEVATGKAVSSSFAQKSAVSSSFAQKSAVSSSFAQKSAVSGSFINNTASSSFVSSIDGLSDCLIEDNSIYMGNDPSGTTSTAQYNVAIGTTALDAITEGDNNTAVGYDAATALTSAGANVAVGKGAGAALTTGASNTIIGMGAGSGTLENNSAVIIGESAGSGVQTAAAEGLIAIGCNSAKSITSGASNIAIGYGAMAVHTTGYQNIAIGAGAMGDTDANDCPTSHNNIFIGFNCGGGIWANDDSNWNVGVGNYALSRPLDGALNNTCVGYAAGKVIDEGTNNTCIGYFAGDTIEDGEWNTVLGSSCNLSAGTNFAVALGTNVEPGDNEIQIGKSGAYLYTTNSSATWEQTSDERKKKNIQDISLGLDFVNDLRTVTFQWRPFSELPEEWGHFHYNKDNEGSPDEFLDDGITENPEYNPNHGNNVGEKIYDNTTDTDTIHHGLIAQEVKAALDTAGVDGENFEGWKEGKNGEQRLAPSAFVYPLIKAVQELSAKIEALENA